nr:hypothetical protein [Tanacetum cinerariifolium]
MGRDTVQLETAVTTISQEYLLEFTSEYGILESLHPEMPDPEDKIVDFLEGKARPRFPKKLEQPLLLGGQEGAPNYCGLAYECSEGRDASREYVFPRGSDNTKHTPYPHPETTRGTTLLSRVEPQILPGRRGFDPCSNPTKVKTRSCPRAAHEVPLLTVTANRVIEMEDPAIATDSSEVPSTIERSPLDFAHENPSQQSIGPEDQETTVPEVSPLENVATTRVSLEAGQAEGVAARVPSWSKSAAREAMMGGKSLAAIELGMRSTRLVPAPQGAPVDVSDPDPLCGCYPVSEPVPKLFRFHALSSKGAAAVGDPDSENTSFASMDIFRNRATCTMMIFLKQYNVNLARQVAMRSQLRLRFEQEAKLLKKSVAQVALRDKRIQARENEIKNLKTLLEAKTDMKKAAKNKSAELSKELENMRVMFSDLQVSNNRLSQQVSTLQEQITREEKLKAAFEEFKQYEDNRVEQRCAEMDACLDALSIDFDEELYLHMLIVIACCRWMIGRGLRLAVMKCGESTELRQAFANFVSAGIAKGMSEGHKHEVEHGKAKLDLEAIEAYDPEAEAKYIAAFHPLKNLKYPLVDQLEGLKDAPMDVIMASFHLESDTGDDAPQWIHELRPSSSQLTIPVYPEVLDPMDPWSCKEEMLLADLIVATFSCAEKTKKCRVVCRMHGVGSAHHARSDGVLVSVPTVVPQGLAILLADTATQTKTSDEASPRLLRVGKIVNSCGELFIGREMRFRMAEITPHVLYVYYMVGPCGEQV